MTRALVVAATALALTVAAPAHAGWRPVVTLLVDAGQGGAAGKRCVDSIAGKLKEAGEDLELTRRDLAAVRAKLPATLAPSVLAWAWADTRPLRSRGRDGTYDAIVVVDCRPDAGTIDVMIAPTSEDVTTVRLRGIAPAPRTIAWLTARIQAASSVGFEL
ncbi:MAG: hypothetical protein IPL61_17410 [Myxococcales bacterium]|nr:hypothetical protein [Myxococcales bacterium]